jgi:hypothetical protein
MQREAVSLVDIKPKWSNWIVSEVVGKKLTAVKEVLTNTEAELTVPTGKTDFLVKIERLESGIGRRGKYSGSSGSCRTKKLKRMGSQRRQHRNTLQ